MKIIENSIEKEILAGEIAAITKKLNEKIDLASGLFLTVTVNQNPKMGSKNSYVTCFVSETISY